MTMRRLLHFANDEAVLSYDSVLGRLALREPTQWRLHVQPCSLEDVLRLLMEALATGREFTVYDPDFSEDELLALTGRRCVPADTIPREPCVVASWADWVEWVNRIAPGSFRLGLFTSGSTGLPKRVMHSWASLTRGLRVSPGHAADVWGFAYNPTHIAGVQVMLQALLNGNPLVDLRGLSRVEIEDRMAQHGVTHLSATPSFYRLLLPLKQPNTQVKRVSLGGEGSDEGLRARLQEAFPQAKIGNIYASTEAGSLFASEGGVFTVPASLAAHVRARDGGLELHRSLLAEFESGAVGDWYATGDQIEVVSEAPLAFKLIGRDREWLNVGGHKVNPAEVEAVLLGCPGVREARVFGRPNSVLGTLLCAEVVAGDAYAEGDVRKWLAERLQAVKIPRILNRVDTLQRSRTGKLARRVTP